MLNSKSFLAVDFGAANLKLAEFEITEQGGLLLRQYAFKSLGQEGTQETSREAAILKGLQDLLGSRSFATKRVNVCAPGFSTFSKFVKLPPVDTSKVTQIIQYEAQQNVPFPLEEVVWDYQILGAAPTGELEVLLVAIKSDVVEGLFKVADAAGLHLQLVDVSPAALCNAFRYNYADLEGCTMLLDIGAKTSNLIFFEKGGVYARGINIGANSITQDFARESRLSFPEAERVKVEEGFVSLGGAYEEPENLHQAAVSKIARQVLTRLHIQVNQTIQFYRGQQGGSTPQRLFLSGGASIMPYLAQFFSEKLGMQAESVEYFNPLRQVEIDPGLNREELAKVAHSLGEVVGLGLRNLAHCPIELNLIPKSLLKRQEIGQKKPYFAGAVFCLILVVFALGRFYAQVAAQKERALNELTAKVAPLQDNDRRLDIEMSKLSLASNQLEVLTGWLEDRTYWTDLFMGLRSALMAVEANQEEILKARVGVWVEKFVPVVCSSGVTATLAGPWIVDRESAAPPPSGLPGTPPPEPPAGGVPVPAGGGLAAKPPPKRPPRGAMAVTSSTGGEVCRIIMQCRALDLSSAAADANTKLAFDLQKELRGRSDLFDTNGITFSPMVPDGAQLTFSFEVTAKLRRPLRF